MTPLNDLREHVTNGEPCPCLPRQVRGVVIHNAYDAREVGSICMSALELLGNALADHRHNWTDAEREAFEHAEALLLMHWPGKIDHSGNGPPLEL